MTQVTVHVPATTANLGPGFDCLGLALDLWNQATFIEEGEGLHIKIRGEGAGLLSADDRNMVVRAMMRFYQARGATFPTGLTILCDNHIPIGAGLGSSAAAIAAGLLGANALLGSPASKEELLRMAVALDGHPDNVTCTLSGGLTMVTILGEGILASQMAVPPLMVALAVPAIHLPTQVARAVLPREVPLSDAVFNISRTAFVIEALRSGNLAMLGKVMEDRLHQPYRMKLIPGAEEAFASARQAGAMAVALSGAGPSIIAFAPVEDAANQAQLISEAMVIAFEHASIQARGLVLSLSKKGSCVSTQVSSTG